MNRFIAMGLNSSIMLLSLIEDILDLSKMEGGTFTITKSFFRIDNLINEVKDIFVYQCRQKAIELNVDFDEELAGLEIYSDEGRIKQILLNLVSNSFKFTFQGSISINVKIVEMEDKEFVQFCVADTGIGIKREDQGKLFKLFGMVPQKQKNINPNGCGIGLTVSKKYVEKLGGHIELKSKYGKGTRVLFTIELVRKEETKESLRLEKRRISLMSNESQRIPARSTNNTRF